MVIQGHPHHCATIDEGALVTQDKPLKWDK